jgi:hypothetical protein
MASELEMERPPSSSVLTHEDNRHFLRMLREEKERYIANLLYMHALLFVDRGGCHGDGRRLRLRPTAVCSHSGLWFWKSRSP